MCAQRFFLRLTAVVGLFAALSQPSLALPIRAYVTGEDLALTPNDVIFQVDANTSIPGSAAFTIVARDSIRLDGLSFLPGSSNLMVVGSTDGPIARYNIATGTPLSARVLPDFVAANPRPSTVFTTSTHIYYVENQFGLAGATNRILRTPIAGPPGTTEVVFDSAAVGGGGSTRFEGLHLLGKRAYFFARNGAAGSRNLMSIGLGGTGLWDGVAPTNHISGLGETLGGGAGADEFEYDPSTGYLFGSNNGTGEIIALNVATGLPVVPPAGTFPYFISPANIAGGSPTGLGLLSVGTPGAGPDGLRSDGHGHLLWVSIGGVIGVIDINGVISNGADDGDIIGLYTAGLAGTFRFDDIAAATGGSGNFGPGPGIGGGFGLIITPEPGTFAVWTLVAAAALAPLSWRRKIRPAR